MSQLQAFTLRNSNGCEMAATNYGGKIMSVVTPDKYGRKADVVLGYAAPQAYTNGNPYFGALIGRYANRIAKGRFVINGRIYQLPLNNNGHCLHGGPDGFHHAVWQVQRVSAQQLCLVHVSADGESGFPGELKCEVMYTLTEENELVIEYRATCKQPTVVNLTHHGFFNLRGAGDGDILDHLLTIYAHQFCPIDATLIPTGQCQSVRGTPFDFLNPHAMGERLAQPHEQLINGNGYDHCWVLQSPPRGQIQLAAEVFEPISGRTMQVWTTEPGLQFYSGNFLDGTDVGREGKPYGMRSAFCLEAQHFPDSPNQSAFPTTVLQPDEHYYQKTVYRFGTVK